MKNLKQRKAFTVVEMVIVIAVIAILATVLIPTISGVIQKANHSTDVQFAASLNIQLALWEVDNGAIENESDLRDAINWYYGDWEVDEDGNKTTLKADGDFYSTLAPKSGKYGYHYWYDVANRQVVVEKYEKLTDINGDGTVPVDEEQVKPTFSPASPRSLILDTDEGAKHYFLMDQAGSAVIEKLSVLNAVTDNGDYALKLQELMASESEAGLAGVVAAKLKNTAIANASGVFFLEDGSEDVLYVYVPYGTETIGPDKIPADNNKTVLEIYIPETVTQLGSGSFIGYIVDKTDEATWEGSATIYANVAESDVGSFVASDAFNCVLELSNGARFAFIDGVLTKLGTDEKIDTEYSVDLKQFNIDYEGDKTADFHFQDDRTAVHTLHITGDTTTFTLKAHSFIDENDASVSRTVSWDKGATNLGNELSVTIDATTLANGDIITVTAQNLKYEIKVEKIGIKLFNATLEQTEGEPFGGESGVVYKAELKYSADSSWKITPNVELFADCVDISTDVSSSLSGEGSGNLKIENGYLKLNGDVSGEFTANLTLTTEGKDKDGNNLTITFELTFKPAASAFEVADNANTYGKYGLDLVVGSGSSIELGTLFTVKSGMTVNTDKIAVMQLAAENDTTGNNILTKSGTDWTKWTIQPTCTADQQVVYIAINDGGSNCVLKVKVAKGAKNVDSTGDWTSVNGQSLVLLIDLKNFADGTGMITITNGTVYGNLHKIYWEDGTYLVKTQADNAIITLNNGTVDNLVIDGPIYSTVSWWSDAATDGMYVAGVYVKGNSTISNSYISGFRSPVASKNNSSVVNITNTTLKGGAAANVYVNEASITINIKDSTMIQFFESNVIGSGIYLDSKATNTGITMTGTAQYTYCSENNAKKLPAISEMLIGQGSAVSAIKKAVGLHKVGTSSEMHIGIVMHKSASVSGWTSAKDVTLNGQTYYYTPVKYIVSTVAQICALKGASSGDCTCSGGHTAKPSWGYSATDYLAHLEATK